VNRQITATVFLLLLIVTGFRILQLGADPPADFSWSGGYFADEGFWSHNARNVVLFGNPVQDDWDARAVSPVFARLQELSFRLFEPGFLQVRLVGLLSSLIIAFTAFALFRTQFDPQAAFLYAILASLNYPMMVLGRQGILDPFAASLCLAALFLALRNTTLSLFFSGVLFVTACATKYLMVYAVVPFAYVVWTSKRYWSFGAGLITTALIWVIFNYLPHRELLGAYSSYYASQQSWNLLDILKNIVTQPFYLYFAKTPAILCLANLCIWFFLSSAINFAPTKFREITRLEKMCFVWLIAGILFFALWRYRPFRYYTSLIPPMAAMAAFALIRLKDLSNGVKPFRSRIVIYFGALLPVAQILFVLFDRWGNWGIVPVELGIHSLDALLLIVLTATVIWSLSRGGKGLQYAACAFVAVLLLSDMRNYLTWMLKPEYNAMQISQDLAKRAPGGIITGQWAPELCLDNKLKVIPVWRDFVNSQNPFETFGITHVLQWKYSLGGEKFEEWYPADFQKFHFVTKYRIKNSDLMLYERSSEASK
jgi:4-amino-4-deoxy-L-arabinose transferase-like glycosyltransferase